MTQISLSRGLNVKALKTPFTTGGTKATPSLVPVRRFPRPSRPIHFGDVSEANGRETHFFTSDYIVEFILYFGWGFTPATVTQRRKCDYKRTYFHFLSWRLRFRFADVDQFSSCNARACWLFSQLLVEGNEDAGCEGEMLTADNVSASPR